MSNPIKKDSPLANVRVPVVLTIWEWGTLMAGLELGSIVATTLGLATEGERDDIALLAKSVTEQVASGLETALTSAAMTLAQREVDTGKPLS